MFFIYTLERNGIPFWVGKCTNKVRRKHKHYNKFGRNITMTIIDEVEDWKFWEKHYISLYRSWGFELENKNDGGGGPSKYTEEQKIKMRKPHPGSGRKISKTLKERNHSKYYTKEVRNKMSISQKGIPKLFTKEHKENLAKANLELKGKVVGCYSLNDRFIEKFNCLREAKEWLLEKLPNISQNVDKQIKDCCNKRQKKCHGYIFKYE